MNRYHLSILGLCETRWTQSGKRRLATGEVILYSGHEEEDAAHTEGVALMLGKEAQKALLGWEARGQRLMTASFKTSQKKIRRASRDPTGTHGGAHHYSRRRSRMR